MLLDLDQGSLSVWRNDLFVGVMVADGLSGPYRWAVRGLQCQVVVASGPARASPTEQQLVAARDYIEANDPFNDDDY